MEFITALLQFFLEGKVSFWKFLMCVLVFYIFYVTPKNGLRADFGKIKIEEPKAEEKTEDKEKTTESGPTDDSGEQ